MWSNSTTRVFWSDGEDDIKWMLQYANVVRIHWTTTVDAHVTIEQQCPQAIGGIARLREGYDVRVVQIRRGNPADCYDDGKLLCLMYNLRNLEWGCDNITTTDPGCIEAVKMYASFDCNMEMYSE